MGDVVGTSESSRVNLTKKLNLGVNKQGKLSTIRTSPSVDGRGVNRNSGVTNRPVTWSASKAGKPSNVDLLTKYPERAQAPIRNFLTDPTKVKKPNRVNKNKECQNKTMSSNEQGNILQSSPAAVPADGDRNATEMSPESLLILQRIDGLSSQVAKAQADHSAEIKKLESSINIRFDHQDKRLDAVESEVTLLKEAQNNNENLAERITALESSKSNDAGAAPNEYLIDWLSKVTNRMEQRDKYEKRFNFIIRGLDISEDPRAATEAFLTSYFKLEDAKNEITNVIVLGKEDKRFLKVTLRNLETKKHIFKSKGGCLKGLPIFIEQDQTPLEDEIGWRARELAREKISDGHSAIVGPNKKSVLIDKVWHVWDQRVGQFVRNESADRPPGRQMSSNVSKTKKKRE